VRTFCGQEGRGSWISALFGTKKLRFFKVYGMSVRTKEERDLSKCKHFADKDEEGQFF